MLPESVQALVLDGVRYVPVTDDVDVGVALAWRSDDRPPALVRLLETVRSSPAF